MGVKIKDGQIQFRPVLLHLSEFINKATEWELPENLMNTDKGTLHLNEHSLGFTVCAVPVIYELTDKKASILSYADGTEEVHDDTDRLTKETSQSLFDREGKISRINVPLDCRNLQE